MVGKVNFLCKNVNWKFVCDELKHEYHLCTNPLRPANSVKKLMNTLKYVVIDVASPKTFFSLNIKSKYLLPLPSTLSPMTWFFLNFDCVFYVERKKILFDEAVKICRHTVRWLMDDEGRKGTVNCTWNLPAQNANYCNRVITSRLIITIFFAATQSHVEMNLVFLCSNVTLDYKISFQRLHNLSELSNEWSKWNC